MLNSEVSTSTPPYHKDINKYTESESIAVSACHTGDTTRAALQAARNNPNKEGLGARMQQTAAQVIMTCDLLCITQNRDYIL